MDMRYVEFAHADPFFYDRWDRPGAPRRDGVASAGRLRLSDDVDWEGWGQATANGWRHLSPPATTLPDQGWKVHVSATLANAGMMLDLVSEYCGRNRITFKCRPARADLLRTNLKYAHRGASGKFITIYPADELACEQILTELDALVGGMDGPYILSDLRWKAGPLYLRYGGFLPMHVRDERDHLVAAIRRPDGELVPDERRPAFTPPDWVRLPPFVVDARDRLAANDDEPFGYLVREALHFSNGGGVYLAERIADGAVVVLKEARPHAGLGPEGQTALERLERERQHLERLSELPSVVDVLDHFERCGHHFLVLEHVEGSPLNRELTRRHPMIRSDTTSQDRAEYRDWALDVLGQVESALGQMHERGQVHGDLHPGNVILAPDGTVRFIDLEMSHRQDGPHPTPSGAPGFTAVAGRTGAQADLYSLACLKIALFVPLTVLLLLDGEKARRLVAEAMHQFGLESSFGTAVLDVLESDHTGNPAGTRPVHVRRVRDLVNAWPIESAEGVRELESGFCRGIWESMDLSRSDRLFPGDIRQFTNESLGIAHGACGVLHAVQSDDMPGRDGRCDDVLDWVSDAVERISGSPVGFFDGITGIAHTMRRFGRHEVADQLYADICGLPFDRLPGDLYGGLAGIGLELMAESENSDDRSILDAVRTIRTVLRDRVGELDRHITEVNGVRTAATGKGGLLYGATGQALFWLRSFEISTDPGDLDLARRALAIDLAACIEHPDGSVQLNEGRRAVPYLGFGSIGVALVAIRLLEHLDDNDLRRMVRKIIHVTCSDFTLQPNLFNGRAGFVLFLAAVQNSEFADEMSRDNLVKHTRDLGLYALVHRTGIHFPGEQMLRASVDWASGSAGVLTALRAYAAVVHSRPAPAPPLLGLLPGSITDDQKGDTTYDIRRKFMIQELLS